mmetsp:Transcript_17667/g.35525  ORF Transcript_17667/g.35525 Transcript_17667/m.35525 type:complete len:201 (-) Transcript_17667:586-1188(-)
MVSNLSLYGVEVPCAFTYPISDLSMPDDCMALSMHAARPAPPGAGVVMWCASHVAPYPASSQYILAPRFSACSKVSRSTTPAPSPITNPARCRSKGREPLEGSSFDFVFIAFMAQNPAKESGVIAASDPPASITSASPRRRVLSASPMECDPTAHAEVTPKFGPCAPSSMPMTPEAVLPRSAGMVNGEHFFGPSLFTLIV